MNGRRETLLKLAACCALTSGVVRGGEDDPDAHAVHGASGHVHHQHDPADFNRDAPERIERRYVMPPVPLIDHTGRQHYLAEALETPGPVFLNFVFTTCPGICPMLSAILAQTIVNLGPAMEGVRLWSVSLDPAYDTPERLADYANLFDAPPGWRFFTGASDAVRQVRRAFEADDDNKMAHRSLILLRSSQNLWLRFEGQHHADTLAMEALAVLRS